MRVLIVEDEERLAANVARGLVAEGFDVDVAHDGQEGLWRAREGSYSAIVLDVLLPGLNGYRVCRALRDESNWTPILMLTAKSGEFDEAESLDNGADDFLSKPFSFVVLVARIRALVRRGDRSRPAMLEAGSLRLDPVTRACARGDEEISLTPREFAVLELLLRDPGEPVPKQRLLDEIWGIDFQGDPNIVEVFVRSVRHKVDRPFALATVETIRGLGYRIVSDQP
jgi:two-component system, OmpR family, response regulator